MSMTDRDRKILMLLVPLVLIGAYWFLLLSPKRHEAAKLSDQVSEAQQARDTAVSQAQVLARAKAQFPSQYAQMVRLGKALPTRVDMPSLLVQLSAAAAGTHIKFGAITVGDRATAPAVTPVTLPSSSSSGSATAYGAAVQKAKDAHAAETNSAAQSSTASNSVGTTGATGATSSTGATSNAPGLDEVPLTFKFGGNFSDLADFFHRLKRFVHIANSEINVQGRLITIDSLKFTSTNFPSLEADVNATIYLTPKDEGTTAGATSSGPQAQQSASIAAVSSSQSSSSSSGSTGTQ